MRRRMRLGWYTQENGRCNHALSVVLRSTSMLNKGYTVSQGLWSAVDRLKKTEQRGANFPFFRIPAEESLIFLHMNSEGYQNNMALPVRKSDIGE